MNRFKTAAVSGFLACTLAAGMLAGCGKADGTAAAVTVNNETLNMGAAEFYLRSSQAQTTSAMISYGMAQAGGEFWDMDMSATSDSEASTYGDNMKETSQESLVNDLVLRQHAADYNVTIPEDMQAELDKDAEALYEANIDVLEKFGTTEDDVKTIMELQSYQTLMLDPMTADTDLTVTDEEAAQSTISYVRAALSSYDSSTYQTTELTDDEKTQRMNELTQVLAEVNAASDPAAADLSTIASGIDADNLYASTASYGADDSVLPAEVTDAAATLKDGEVYGEVIVTDSFYYVIRMDATFDREATDAKKESLANTKKNDAYQEILQGWVDASDVKWSSAWNKLEVTDKDGYSAKAAETAADSTEAASTSVVSGSSAE